MIQLKTRQYLILKLERQTWLELQSGLVSA
jgi:hypothetical protein